MKAAFLDRDGVLNELCYFPDAGVIDSPFTPKQLRLTPGAARGVKLLNRLGLKVVIVSNQPGIAKGHFSRATLEAITRKLLSGLRRQGGRIDAVYYCLHHPQAKVRSLRQRCRCRKPRPGLILRAASELGLDLKASYVLGDSVSDIAAGRRAGCRTIYVGRWKCDICHLMDAHHTQPDFAAENVWKAARLIQKLESDHGNLPRLGEP